MTPQEKVQLTHAINDTNKSNHYYLNVILFTILSTFFFIKLEWIKNGILVFILSIIFMSFMFKNLHDWYVEKNRISNCLKKLKQYAKDGKTFDDAYALLFEEKEKQ